MNYSRKPPDGTARIVLKIKLPDRTLSADIATKSLRRAQTTIRDLGNENVACLLQGNLSQRRDQRRRALSATQSEKAGGLKSCQSSRPRGIYPGRLFLRYVAGKSYSAEPEEQAYDHRQQ